MLEINRKALEVPVAQQEDGVAFVSALVNVLAKEVNELVSLDVLGIAVLSEESTDLHYTFSAMDDGEEEMKLEMHRAFETKTTVWDA